jgi:hypothetical protein
MIHKTRLVTSRFLLPAIAIVVGLASLAHADTAAAPKIDGADTAWLLTSAVLVLMMTIPGLALFYGGMVRRKNVLSTLMQSFILVGVVSLQWVIFGYSLAFSPGNPIIGSLSWFGLSGVSASELLGHGPSSGVHGLSMHVRDHYARAHNRGDRGADVVQGLPGVQHPVDHAHL